jgi:PIN domain
LHTRFADRIVPIDARIAEEWGRLSAAASRNIVDSLIAATGRVHGLTVVTRNTGATKAAACRSSTRGSFSPTPSADLLLSCASLCAPSTASLQGTGARV